MDLFQQFAAVHVGNTQQMECFVLAALNDTSKMQRVYELYLFWTLPFCGPEGRGHAFLLRLPRGLEEKTRTLGAPLEQ